MLRPRPTALPRIVSRGRPASDPGCAGCPQLGVFRALRRAGLEVQGGSGCDGDPDLGFTAASGRWAAVTGAGRVLASGGAVVRDAAAAGARLVVVADRAPADPGRVPALLARAGAKVLLADPEDLSATEAAARAAAEHGYGEPDDADHLQRRRGTGSVLVLLSDCPREAANASAPLSIAAARCNRCGACLCLGCPAIADTGGEAMEIDPAVCTGCGLCAPLCRGRAIACAGQLRVPVLPLPDTASPPSSHVSTPGA